MKTSQEVTIIKWGMKVTVIPIVIDALGKNSKGLVKWLELLEIVEPVEIIQTTA